jgi:hypothetical protein
LIKELTKHIAYCFCAQLLGSCMSSICLIFGRVYATVLFTSPLGIITRDKNIILYSMYKVEISNRLAFLHAIKNREQYLICSWKIFVIYVKGTVSQDFRPSVFFSSNNTPWAPDSRAKSFLNSASNSQRYDRFSNAKIVHAVSRTPHARKIF